MCTSLDNVCTSSSLKDCVAPTACFKHSNASLGGVITALVHTHSTALFCLFTTAILVCAQVGCVGDGKSNMEEFDVSEVIKEQNRVSYTQ
jgi:hypothetical protein